MSFGYQGLMAILFILNTVPDVKLEFEFYNGGILSALKYENNNKCFAPEAYTTPGGVATQRVKLTTDCSRIYRYLPSGKIMDEASQKCLDVRGDSFWFMIYVDCDQVQKGIIDYHSRSRPLLNVDVGNDEFHCAQVDANGYMKMSTRSPTCYNPTYTVLFVSPGMMWYDNNNDVQDQDLQDANLWYRDAFNSGNYEGECSAFEGRRLCTAPEVCPNGRLHQSMIGDGRNVDEHIRYIPIVGGRSVKATTCQVAGATTSATAILCCPAEYPHPKIYTKEGVGYLIHQSGKCVHVVADGTLKLKDSCGGETAALRWATNGQMILLKDNTCLKFANGKFVTASCSQGGEARFQFTKDRTLQDLTTGRCIVPKGATEDVRLNPPVDTELEERDDCDSEASIFLFQDLKGVIKHSTNKCIGTTLVNSQRSLVLQTDCDDGEEIFIKAKYESTVLHVVSNKCLQNSGGNLVLGSCALPTDDSSFTDADNCFKLDNGRLKTCSGNKCISGTGITLTMSTTCNTDASKLQFIELSTQCTEADCSCGSGFTKKGQTCIPVDKCKTNNGDCVGAEDMCVYTGPGTNICICPPGFQLHPTGRECTECTGKNCFAGCDFYTDQELKDAFSEQERLVLRFTHVKSSDLSEYLTTENTKQEVVIYTQILSISGSLKLEQNTHVAIFVNQIVLEGGSIELESNDVSNGMVDYARVSHARVRNNVLVCEDYDNFDDKHTYENSVQGATLAIYPAKTGIPFTCTANYNMRAFANLEALTTKKTPRHAFDVEFLSLGIACAKVMAQDISVIRKQNENEFLLGSPPVEILQYVLEQVEHSKTAPELAGDNAAKSALSLVGLRAADLMANLEARAEGLAFVPYLSLRAHEELLKLLQSDARMAIDQYERYRSRAQQLEDKLDATRSMTHLMTAIVKQNDRNIEAMKRELDVAIEDRKQIEAKMRVAESDMETARVAFEEGVREYQTKMIINAVFTCIGAVASIFSGGAATVSVLGDLGSLPGKMSKFSKTLIKINAIMETIGGINEACDGFKEAHYNQIPYAQSGAASYYTKGNTPSKQGGNSLALKVIEWDLFATQARGAFMGTAENEISGTGPYLASIEGLAIVGKAYHEKIIAIEELMNKLISAEDLQKDQSDAQAKIEKQITESRADNKINADLLVEMALQKERLRRVLVDTLLSFCDAYFYNWLSECPVMPTLSDDLYALHSKVNEALSSVIKGVDNFAPFVAQDFETDLIIQDQDINCNEGEATQLTDCAPITKLKSSRSFLYELKDDSRVLKNYERVHIDELEVYLNDVTVDAGQPITVFISFSGLMTDVYKGKEYKFVSPPRVTVFAYEKSGISEVIVRPGKVSNKFQEYYDGIAAKTTWMISVPESDNHSSLDLFKVTSVRMKFKGTCVHKSRSVTTTTPTTAATTAAQGGLQRQMKDAKLLSKIVAKKIRKSGNHRAKHARGT